MSRPVLVVVVSAVLLLALLVLTGSNHLSDRVFVPTEVVVLTGVAAHGEMIPLPTYADDTLATEDECQWTVGVNTVYYPNSGALFKGITCTTGDPHPRSVSVVLAMQMSSDHYGSANYMIIATRTEPASSVSERSWGEVKAGYR